MATKLPKSTATKAKAKTPRAAVGKTSATTEDRRAIAMQMLLAGHNCPYIGKALGITRQGAWGLAKEAMAELKTETLEDAATWRAPLTQEHLEQLRKSMVQLERGLRAADDAVAACRNATWPAGRPY